MATMEELERRVEQLEEQVRHVLPAKIDAVAYGLSLVHEDLRAFRDETRTTLAQHGEQLAGVDRRLDRHGEMLTEILRRLPA